ncbi:cell division protein FtsA [Candidatus Kaiserbacteria bacterium RIFCSPHIGHO2_01_FULL_49_13]|uniref:Cell division protein FtsA n=1 Tax=Candidatus Kaiserbacteria bacterium RIFCSPHIGHO2_01_FULL_49_13 TaxID=1798477 RepID=A0A1F6CEK4_9BACT|nr:MAG: cell division protein FtsA [Candidatus Kaiserbacteria bacterium RIFCSPHIGHO2_01_FULL_49_13]
MAKRTIIGIDIGSHQVKVVVAEDTRGVYRGLPVVLGTGLSESKGLHHGYIVNRTDVIRSLRNAVAEAQKSSGIRIRRAFVSVGGVSLEGFQSRGEAVVSRADLTVTDLDINQAVRDAEHKLGGKLLNRKIIHSIPVSYRIDGETVLGGKPHDMRGSKLEVEMLFIACLEQHVTDLIEAIEEAGVIVEDVMAAPLAASFITLEKRQKMVGCVLANIGAETVSIVVFENNLPISLKVFPIGSTDITNDIALGLKISLEEAERIKLGAITATAYPKKKLEEIVSARLSDIFDLVEAHLKKIGKDGLLPAGIILTGGGSSLTSVSELARAALKLPARTAPIYFNTDSKGQLKDSAWAVAYGLCIFGFSADTEETGIRVKEAGSSLAAWLRQFLP